MLTLCDDLDGIERRSFELEKAVRDYELMRTEQLPKLRADMEALRYSEERSE